MRWSERERVGTDRLTLLVEFADELCPVLETDLEHLTLLDLGDLDEVQVRVEEELLVLVVLDQLEVLAQKVGEEQREVEHELLVLVLRLVVRASDVCQR